MRAGVKKKEGANRLTPNVRQAGGRQTNMWTGRKVIG